MNKKIKVSNSLGSTLLQKQIKPERYLWHVSNSFFQKSIFSPSFTRWGLNLHHHEKYIQRYLELSERTFIGIQKRGIVFGNTNAVFAHNGIDGIDQMHPIWMDRILEDVFPHIKGYNWLKTYDFWRIDTEAYEADWYFDPFMVADLLANITKARIPGKPRARHYVCSNVEVPPHALTCFSYHQVDSENPFSLDNLSKVRWVRPDYLRPVSAFSKVA